MDVCFIFQQIYYLSLFVPLAFACVFLFAKGFSAFMLLLLLLRVYVIPKTKSEHIQLHRCNVMLHCQVHVLMLWIMSSMCVSLHHVGVNYGSYTIHVIRQIRAKLLIMCSRFPYYLTSRWSEKIYANETKLLARARCWKNCIQTFHSQYSGMRCLNSSSFFQIVRLYCLFLIVYPLENKPYSHGTTVVSSIEWPTYGHFFFYSYEKCT